MHILESARLEEVKERDEVTSRKPPSDLLTKIKESLEDANYHVENDLVRQFLLSAVTAAATGQIVLLSGPTGVGKTSLVSRMSTVLGVGPEESGRGVLPVRPSWIEPADLIGFHNASTELYETTPFIDELTNAKRYAEAGELYFCVLDEMNLARIENYGADLLALLEKSRDAYRKGRPREVTIRLFSDLVAKGYTEELQELVSRRSEVDEDSEAAREIDRRIKRLDSQPSAELLLPPGFVLYGTLNADETTHPLSPKVKDRAFVLQLEAPLLDEDILANGNTSTPKTVWQLTQEFVDDLDPHAELPKWARDSWDDIISWQEPYLHPMGIHLSHRFAEVFCYYILSVKALHITPRKKVGRRKIVGDFLAMKLLPWISFHRSEKAAGMETRKEDLLRKWADELDDYGSLKKTVQGILDRGDLTYEYIR